MSYNSKKILTGMLTGVAIFIAYIVFSLGEHSPKTISSWAIAMLAFIGVGIVASIVIQILFHVGLAIGVAVKNQSCEDDEIVERIISSATIEDERDKLISLKSAHIGYVCEGIGFMCFLAILANGSSVVLALNVLFGAFFAGSLVEGVVSIFLYEKGVNNQWLKK